MMYRGQTLGALASQAWLQARGLDATTRPHWYVEIALHSDLPKARFDLNIYPEEWGFVFRRGTRVSSIRVTDVAFIHGLDDYRLLGETPALAHISDLLAMLETRYELTFDRTRAEVRSNLPRAHTAVRPWLARDGHAGT